MALIIVLHCRIFKTADCLKYVLSTKLKWMNAWVNDVNDGCLATGEGSNGSWIEYPTLKEFQWFSLPLPHQGKGGRETLGTRFLWHSFPPLNAIHEISNFEISSLLFMWTNTCKLSSYPVILVIIRDEKSGCFVTCFIRNWDLRVFLADHRLQTLS